MLCLNKLYEATSVAASVQTGASLDALITCVVDHFAHEEREIEIMGFAGFEIHKEEYDKLIDNCTGLQTKFYASEVEVIDEVGQVVIFQRMIFLYKGSNNVKFQA